MSNINLTWDVDGVPESFNVYRSTSPISIDNMPPPIATEVSDNTYVDEAIVEGVTYFYRVASLKGETYKVSAEISVSAEAGDEYFESVNFLIFADGTSIVDSSDNSKTVSNTSVTLVDSSVIAPKYDDKSMYFNGSAYLTVAHDALGTSDFTLEAFVRISSGTSWSPIFESTGISLMKRTETAMTRLLLSVNSVNIFVSDTVYITNNTWQHVCVMRKSGQFYLYVDGVSSGKNTAQNTFALAGTAFKIMSGLVGYMNSIRLTKGVARYDTSGFTQPGEKFKAF